MGKNKAVKKFEGLISIAGYLFIALFILAPQNATALDWLKNFDANRDRIRNPDLIYPGQVFVLPTAEGN